MSDHRNAASELNVGFAQGPEVSCEGTDGYPFGAEVDVGELPGRFSHLRDCGNELCSFGERPGAVVGAGTPVKDPPVFDASSVMEHSGGGSTLAHLDPLR